MILTPIRFFHTVRHLRPAQVFGRFRHRFIRPAVNLSPAPELRCRVGRWVPPVGKPAAMVGEKRFRFLNVEYPLASASDWNSPDRPKLWLYNLHYFDALNTKEKVDLNSHLDLIHRWVVENPPGSGNGWEPYPTSLRLVNWIKWELAGNDLPPEAVQSLAVQARYLRKRLEYHLLGNHLFANGKALTFAGLFFAGQEAEEWLSKGLKILSAEIPEQILSDGGHFERSPMYHAIILEDLLDLVNLFRAYGRKVPADWLDACSRMRAWLRTMTHPDGDIVLFNDAAFGIAPTLLELDAYASGLGLAEQESIHEAVTRLAETGYVRCQKGGAVLFLDVAPVGPDYIPGHAHADTLTFELSLFGHRVIVDCGTSTYEKNEVRQRQRGTAAHNTVTIDAHDSSEVWGGFRVARRAKPFGLGIEQLADQIHVVCAHDGYRRLGGTPVHRREWRLTDNELSLRDTIEGGFREAIARFHLHPKNNIEMTGPQSARGNLQDGRPFSILVQGGNARLRNVTYHPEFNNDIPNLCLEVRFDCPAISTTFLW